MRQRHVCTGRASRHSTHTRVSALGTSVRPSIMIYVYRSKADPTITDRESRAETGEGSRLGPGLRVSLIAARFRMKDVAFTVHDGCLKARLCQSLAFALL